jgi:hypothetical protein
MNGYDHYIEAKSIVDCLGEEGFVEQATAVRNAIDNGVSGTEIFMQLRFYLTPLMANIQVDETTRFRIGVLVDKIEEALTR